MKQYQEIRTILTQEFGFENLDNYKKWVTEVRPTVVPTPELVSRLSPDTVDCGDFWKVCEELFGDDPVCNVTLQPQVGSLPFTVESRMDSNRLNLRLAKTLGITAFL